jgi:polyhydroxyalkanoate synthase subunit PhaC
VSDTVLNALRRAQFDINDILRRAQGDVVGAFGLDPQESPHQIITSGAHWCLRDYGGNDRSRSLLIIAAPIKRPYIWDLTPSISAIRFCLHRGLSIQLLEWMPASPHAGNNGLDEYVLAISEAVATTAAQGAKPFLIGHSLGGTLAAIYGAFLPESIRGLVLLGAPLCFEPSANQFRDALVTLVPREISDTDPFPGSLLSHSSALASPRTFIWSRLIDAAMNIADPLAMEIHARVERWALDEVPLPGKLVHQIIDWLYRENRFCRGSLKICEKVIGPSSLSVPTLVVVNTTDEIAPLNSIKPFADAMPKNVRVNEYPGELGVCLQHLGILVGRHAQAHVWPEIVSWLKSLSGDSRADGS